MTTLIEHGSQVGEPKPYIKLFTHLYTNYKKSAVEN